MVSPDFIHLQTYLSIVDLTPYPVDPLSCNRSCRCLFKSYEHTTGNLGMAYSYSHHNNLSDILH